MYATFQCFWNLYYEHVSSIDKIKSSHAFKEVKADDDWESLTALFQMSDNCEQSARNCGQTDILGHRTETREFKVTPWPADTAGRMSFLSHFTDRGAWQATVHGVA